MAQRRPIALVGGLPREIPSTDQVVGDASAMTVTETGGVAKTAADALAGKASLSGAAFTGGVTIPNLQTRGNYSGWVFYNPAGPVNSKYWLNQVSEQALGFMTLDDAFSNPIYWLSVQRSGVQISSITFAARPNWLGYTPWDSNNFNPTNYANINAANNYASGALQSFRPTGVLAASGGNGAGIEIRADGTATGGAFILFHRPGDYATRFGLNENREWAFGGFSDGVGTQYRFLTEKNLNTFTVKSPTVASPAIRTIDKKLFERHDIRDYAGIDLTGNNDCASIVQTALQNSSYKGTLDTLHIPRATIALGSVIDVTDGVWMKGDGKAKILYQRPDRGTTFLIGHTGAGFKSRNQYMHGRLCDFSTMRIQPDPTANGPFTPNNHDFDFDLSSRTSLVSVHMVNPTKALSIQAPYGQGHLYDISGNPFTVGLFMDNTYDTTFADRIEWWPYWARDLSIPSSGNNAYWKIQGWTLNNLNAFTLGRVDAFKATNWFSIMHRVGLVLQNTNGSNPGSTTGEFVNINIDAGLSTMQVLGNNATVTFTSLSSVLYDPLPTTAQMERAVDPINDHAIQIQGTGNYVHIGHCNHAWARLGVVNVGGNKNTLVVDQISPRLWNRYGGPAYPAVINGNPSGNDVTVKGVTWAKGWEHDDGTNPLPPPGPLISAGVRYPSMVTSTGSVGGDRL